MKASKSILVVEDEADLAEAVCYHLQREGFACRRAADGQTALNEVARQVPDLIVLDRMLPTMSGDDVLLKLRADGRSSNIPVVMLTAKSEEADELVGFAIGADDYVRKPFSIKLLLARVAAVLRRKELAGKTQDVIVGGPVVLDRTRHEVVVDSRSVALTATEFRMLAALMGGRGRVLGRDQLIDLALGSTVAVTQRTIDVHVAALRKKLGSAAGWIQTIRGAGYSFRPPTDAPEG